MTDASGCVPEKGTESVTSGWVQPPNPTVVAEYWLTRRDADAAPGYGSGGALPDIRVRSLWNGNGAWVSGYYQGVQRLEAQLASRHTNNGWRLDPLQVGAADDE